MAEVKIGAVKIGGGPFKEAIDYFKAKTPMPSQAYTDLLHEMHDKGFVVAGVTDAALLTDVHQGLLAAMRDGTPFDQWQKGFNKTIDGRWLPTTKTGVPNTGWRARAIYDTNMATAYAAGSYQQRMRMVKTHPFWQYRIGISKTHRPEHAAWDGMVLRWDDPWWDGHSPPNGYNCHCRIKACDEIDLRELGKAGPDKAPPDATRKTNFGGRVLDVPKGVDPGWGYAPGAGGNQGLLRSLAQGAPEISAQAWEGIKEAALRQEAEAFREAAGKAIKAMSEKLQGDAWKATTWGLKEGKAWVVGFMDAQTLKAAKNMGMAVPSAALEVVDVDMFHAMRAAHPRIPEAAYLNMPELLANPKAVYYDAIEGSLVYEFDPGIEGMAGVFVVKAGKYEAATRAKKKRRPLCKVRTAYLMPKAALADAKHYVPIRGGAP